MRRALGIGLALSLLGAVLYLSRRAPLGSSGPPAASAPTAPTAPRVATPAQAGPRREVDAGTATPRTLARLAWGSGRDQVARRADPESAGEGPMAIAAGRDGEMYLLDQVQRRIVRRAKDGSFLPPIAIKSDTAQDLRATRDGLALLDRLGDKAVTRLSASGAVQEERPLSSLGVVEAGGVTGLWEGQGGALFVEESVAGQGRRVLRPLAGGPPLDGRPSRDGGQLLSAAIDRATPGALAVRGVGLDGSPRFSVVLTVERPILAVLLLDSDVEGGIYVGVTHAAPPVPPSHDLTDERLELFRLAPGGALRGRLAVPHPPGELEQLRPLEVAGPGRVWWMHPDADRGIAVEELLL